MHDQGLGFHSRARSTVSPLVKVNSSRLATNAPEPRSLEVEGGRRRRPRERLVESCTTVTGQVATSSGAGARSTEANLSAESGVGRDVTTSDSAVADVAHDQDS